MCESPLSSLGTTWEPPGSILGASCEHPSVLGAPWERPGSTLGAPEPTWELPGSFLGAYLEALGTPWEHPRSTLGGPEPSGSRLGTSLGASWRQPGNTLRLPCDHCGISQRASMTIGSPADRKHLKNNCSFSRFFKDMLKNAWYLHGFWRPPLENTVKTNGF